MYDPLYRLVQATGREHPGQQPNNTDPVRGNIPHQNDLQALLRYTEQYEYDEAGNITDMTHTATGNNWNRAYQYNATSNKLLGTSAPGDPAGTYSNTYTYNAHGSMASMPHITALVWNYTEQLESTDLGGGGIVYYSYDSGGTRVRKVYEHSGVTEERIYLGGYEIYRRRVGTTLSLERQTLHVSDAAKRILLFETKTVDVDNSAGLPQVRVRWQLDNHLGSSGTELDNSAQVISYEEYHSFGSTSFHTVNGGAEVSAKRYRYTGKERDDETGLYYYGARYYAAWLGRWTGCDPSVEDGLNLYVYIVNNPINGTDPDGRATKQQFQELISTALDKIGNGNRTAKGEAAEIVLEGMLKKAGHIIIKGPVANKGSHFADIVTFDPSSKELFFFDNKFQAGKEAVSKVDAFKSGRQADVIKDAYSKFQKIAADVPYEHAKDIEKAFKDLSANPGSANFVVSNASPKTLKNFVNKISDRLTGKGIKFADASGGSKKLQKNIDALVGESKNLDETADALKKTSKAGSKVLKALPVIGIALSAGLAVPRVAQAREEDTAYEDMMLSMGAEPKLKGLSTLRELAIITGEEAGGEAGAWSGGVLAGLLAIESGPGAAAAATGGAVAGGIAGDWVGGKIAAWRFDSAAQELYKNKCAQ